MLQQANDAIALERKIAAADRLRKLQIKNINALFDYKISALQSSLTDRLNGVAPTLTVLGPAVTSAAATSARSRKRGSYYERGENKKVKAGAKSLVVSSIKPSIELRDEDAKLDIARIEADTNSQKICSNAQPYKRAHIVRECEDSLLIVDGERFRKKDPVTIFSTSVAETFVGVIEEVDCPSHYEQVIIRTCSGPKIVFDLRCLEQNRVRIRRDSQYDEDEKLINAAVQIRNASCK